MRASPRSGRRFERDSGGALPRAAALAVAAPIEGDMLTFMNIDWRIDRHGLAGELGLEQLTLLNDFGAVAHAVSVMAPDELIAALPAPATCPPTASPPCSAPAPASASSILDRRGGGVARDRDRGRRISASARSTRRRRSSPTR